MDSTFWNDEYKGDPLHVDVPDYVLEPEVRALRPGAALDLGCGSGKNAMRLAELGWSVVGVDWAEQAIALAERAARERGYDVRFLAADITRWKPERTFDLVVSTYALPGGAGSRSALATAARALAPGGTLLIAEWDRSMAAVWPFEAADMMTSDEIVAALPGLDIERAEVRRIEVFGKQDPRAFAGTQANVAFVRARRSPGREEGT